MAKIDIKPGMVFIALDGDGIGKKVGRAVIANDFDELSKVSARIDAAQDFILHWAKQIDGIKISGGGDEATIAIPKEAEKYIESLRKDIEHAFGYTISVGVGKSLSEAGTALLVAKLRGKDRIVHFNEEIKKEIKKAKRRVREHRATQEEYKLSEAYLEKKESSMEENKEKPDLQDCQYCEQTDGVDADHCKYCHDEDKEEDCKYCNDNELAENSEDCKYCKDNAEDADECSYCKDDAASGPKEPEIAEMDGHAEEQNTKIQSPDSNNASAPAGSAEEKQQYQEMGMNPPAIGKPEMGDSSPSGVGEASPAFGGAPVETQGEKSNEEKIEEEGAHSKETLQEIAQQIEKETASGKPEEKEEAKQIDDTEVVGSEMEGNISRPENYNSNTPGDMGMEQQHVGEDNQDNPDLGEVLKEGLDSKADDIQKEKVREMVGQALSEFKASKSILEQSQQQSPQLYNASIMMLKAMIEMAKMLGLGANTPDIQKDPKEENEWNNPFPVHPDQGGERKPGHAAGQGDAAPAPQQ